MNWKVNIEFCMDTNRLNRADLPTFGRPISSTVGSMLASTLLNSMGSLLVNLTLGPEVEALLLESIDASSISWFELICDGLVQYPALHRRSMIHDSEINLNWLEPQLVAWWAFTLELSTKDPNQQKFNKSLENSNFNITNWENLQITDHTSYPVKCII